MFLEKFMTSAHFGDIPYRTTLNAELRNPQEVNAIRAILYCQQAVGNLTDYKNGGMDYCTVSTESAEKLKEKFNLEFKNLFPTFFPKTRYRGCSLPNDIYEKIVSARIGDVVVPDEGFAYYAKDKKFAEYFARGEHKTLIKCKIPIFSKISRMIFPVIDVQSEHFSFPKSDEVMVQAGCKYKLLSKHIDKDGVMNLCLKLLRK